MHTVPNIIPLSTIDVIPTYENTTNNLTKLLTTGLNAIVSVYVEIDINFMLLSNGMMLAGKQ